MVEGNCGAMADCCRAYTRIAAHVIHHCPVDGDIARQYVLALGAECVFCHETITNSMTGHDCNIYGPHHEDCEPY